MLEEPTEFKFKNEFGSPAKNGGPWESSDLIATDAIQLDKSSNSHYYIFKRIIYSVQRLQLVNWVLNQVCGRPTVHPDLPGNSLQKLAQDTV